LSRNVAARLAGRGRDVGAAIVKDELLQHVELHVRKAYPDRKLIPDAGSWRGCGNDE
jgi:hypothetical protein